MDEVDVLISDHPLFFRYDLDCLGLFVEYKDAFLELFVQEGHCSI